LTQDLRGNSDWKILGVVNEEAAFMLQIKLRALKILRDVTRSCGRPEKEKPRCDEGIKMTKISRSHMYFSRLSRNFKTELKTMY
jgi:hypothetical protein